MFLALLICYLNWAKPKRFLYSLHGLIYCTKDILPVPVLPFGVAYTFITSFTKKTSMKKNILTMLLLFIVFFTSGLQRGWSQATATNFKFVQYDRFAQNGSLLFARSSLGSVSFSPVTSPFQNNYLNIYAKTVSGQDAWIVENYPLPAQEVMTCQQVEIDYKYLGIAPGTPVYSIQYSYTVTPYLVQAVIIADHDHDTIRTTEDSDINVINGRKRVVSFASQRSVTDDPAPVPFPVPPAPVIVTRDSLRNEMSSLYNEYADFALFQRKEPVVEKPVSHDVPPVEEDPGNCTAGAFARSIGWLEKKDSAGTRPYYDSLKKYHDTCVTGTTGQKESCKVKSKADFLKRINGGTTTVMPIDPEPGFPPADLLSPDPKPANPGDWMKDKLKTCDVEMAYSEINFAFSHIVTVTRVECDGKGCCTIWFRDDADQNKKGGDACEKSIKLCNDTFRRDGQKFKVWYLVAECKATNRIATTQEQNVVTEQGIILEQNKPNPFGSETTITIRVADKASFKNAFLVVRDMYTQEVYRSRLNLQKGNNSITYRPATGLKGILYYSLELDGKTIDTKQMIFQNY